ncbi:MAG: hypothetical protein H0W30_02655 [Gemmatimonadaceae bacterium]|nr:hypothetical protein [Gemmatimonadaceae bacterium]MDQ3519735.1 hypothetical protein [Gemmatimonadota bacterium]
MKFFILILAIPAIAAAPPIVRAQSHGTPHEHHTQRDTAFSEMQQRGQNAMGVDQYTSAHTFEALAYGGRIVLQAAPTDTAAVARIRAHFRLIARAFARGDFAIPGFVHAGEVPGIRVMTARRKAIRFLVSDLPLGAEMRITTRDKKALRAIREFLAFQRREHHTGGE